MIMINAENKYLSYKGDSSIYREAFKHSRDNITATRYEIRCYESNTGAEGGIEKGFCVYVRNYESDTEGDWDEVYCENFKTEEEAHATIAELLILYPNAKIIFY